MSAWLSALFAAGEAKRWPQPSSPGVECLLPGPLRLQLLHAAMHVRARVLRYAHLCMRPLVAGVFLAVAYAHQHSLCHMRAGAWSGFS